MKLFERIPDKFFSILASPNKSLYVEALFVVRQAFKSELVIRRGDLASMLMDSLEAQIIDADFSGEADDELAGESADALSGKASFLIRKLMMTGWIDKEFESRSFEENITVPDYAIEVINLLYDLTIERVREYNSYVYATYSSLENSRTNPDYLYQALQAAYQNTVSFIDELKTLYNNIRQYHQRLDGKMDINVLLSEHFDDYKEQIFDTIYFPLKTIDSVPRFKHSILSILNDWLMNEDTLEAMIRQGVERHVFSSAEEGREEVLKMITFIADNYYDGIEEMIEKIDDKHRQYTNASIDRMRYLMNTDQSAKGKLIDLLRHSSEMGMTEAMQNSLMVYCHRYADSRSLYHKVKRTRRAEGKSLAITPHEENPELVEGFLDAVRKQFSNQRIDAFVLRLLGDGKEVCTQEVEISSSEDFLFFLLSTIRGREKDAPFTAEFLEGNTERDGYGLPNLILRKKEK